MKRTGAETPGAGWFRVRGRLVVLWHGAMLAVLLSGVCAGRAEPPSASGPGAGGDLSLSAWRAEASKAGQDSNAVTNECADFLLHCALWMGERGHPWNGGHLTHFGNQFDFPSDSGSGSETISVPAALSETPPDLQSIPTDETAAEAGPSWDRAPEETGARGQFSAAAEPWTTSPPTMPGPQESGAGLDSVVPGAVRRASRLEFSSSGDGGAQAGGGGAGGGLPGEARWQDRVILPPGPIPQIASPEPTVTAFWVVSALLFACRGRGVKR